MATPDSKLTIGESVRILGHALNHAFEHNRAICFVPCWEGGPVAVDVPMIGQVNVLAMPKGIFDCAEAGDAVHACIASDDTAKSIMPDAVLALWAVQSLQILANYGVEVRFGRKDAEKVLTIDPDQLNEPVAAMAAELFYHAESVRSIAWERELGVK